MSLYYVNIRTGTYWAALYIEAADPEACPKGLRHGAAVAMLHSDVPIHLIKRFLGHARISTTEIYLDVSGPEERALISRFWQTPRHVQNSDAAFRVRRMARLSQATLVEPRNARVCLTLQQARRIPMTQADTLNGTIGNNVRFYRLLRGWALERLAQPLEITFQQLQKYENGKNRISAARLFIVASLLEVPIGAFRRSPHG